MPRIHLLFNDKTNPTATCEQDCLVRPPLLPVPTPDLSPCEARGPVNRDLDWLANRNIRCLNSLFLPSSLFRLLPPFLRR